MDNLIKRKIILDGQELLDLIPHRDPFVLVDKLFYHDPEKTKAGFSVPNDHYFVDDGFFTEFGLIENIAQTTGVHVGLYRRDKGIDIGIGFIGSISNFILNFRPKADAEIETIIYVLNVVMGVVNVKGQVYQDDKLCAECEMKVFPPSQNN
ncbi:MAG: hypothetical protein ACEPOW_12550 [Bacteroidales bacterium]